jgi:DNA-binding PadR family transcriptional regulator
MPKTDGRENTPLTEATFYILLSLVSRPKHGYAIMKEVELLSEGRILFSTGTLYGAIKRFIQLGWIQRLEEKSRDKTSRPRKVYALTQNGQRILDTDLARLQVRVKAARLRMVRAG